MLAYFSKLQLSFNNGKKRGPVDRNFLALTAILQTTLEKIAMQLSDSTSMNQMCKFEKNNYLVIIMIMIITYTEKDIAPNFK